MASDNPLNSPRIFLLTLALLSTLWLVSRTAACVDEDPRNHATLDTQNHSLRDVLGTQPLYIQALTERERDTLRLRLVEATLEDQHTILDPLSSNSPAPHAPHASWPTDPLNALARIDQQRTAQELDIRPTSIIIQTEDGVLSHPCPLSQDDLLTQDGWPRLHHATPTDPAQWPTQWTTSPSWDHNDLPELHALQALAPSLARWATRCEQSVHKELEKQNHTPQNTRTFQRSPNAPYLLAFSPQRHKLYIHPALLTLWSTPRPSTIQTKHPDLQTRSTALTLPSDDIETCLTDLEALCNRCAPNDGSQPDPSCANDQFFPNSTLSQDCRTLSTDIEQGLPTFCVYTIFENRPDVISCVNNDKDGLCDRKNQPVNSVETLLQAYAVYTDPTRTQACQDAVNVCANPGKYGTTDPCAAPNTCAEPPVTSGGDTKEGPKTCGDRLGCD